jgi:hypothetical protein
LQLMFFLLKYNIYANVSIEAQNKTIFIIVYILFLLISFIFQVLSPLRKVSTSKIDEYIFQKDIVVNNSSALINN